ncbi:SPFH domain-containing protein [Paenibacillus amylolyticus]|uniref:prohibitin family protein n=1 Tax=Paenibacillus amylolyticus TaxID=1451 RepID=UPI003D9513A8
MKNSKTFRVGAIAVALVIIVGVLLVTFFLTRIPNGYVGVVYSPNGGVKDSTLSQGWKLVGAFDKVTKYPIRIQTVEYRDIQIATSDGKNITIDFAYNYQVEPSKVSSIFNTFGPISIQEIEDTYLKTRFRDAARKGISKFTVIDVYGEKSSEAGVDVQQRFSDDVKDLGFIVSNVTVGVPQPDAKTQEAIDKRVEASQELERKTTELEIAKKEADRKRVEAQGNADKLLIEAEGQAKANKELQQSLSSQLVEYETIKKWDGALPYVSGSNTPMIQLPTTKTEQNSGAGSVSP